MPTRKLNADDWPIDGDVERQILVRDGCGFSCGCRRLGAPPGTPLAFSPRSDLDSRTTRRFGSSGPDSAAYYSSTAAEFLRFCNLRGHQPCRALTFPGRGRVGLLPSPQPGAAQAAYSS